MKIACENIDRLVNVGIRPPGMPCSAMNKLYDAAKGENAISTTAQAPRPARRQGGHSPARRARALP